MLIKHFVTQHVTAIVIALLVVVLSFIWGMQYQSYRIASAFKQASESFSASLWAAFSGTQVATEEKKPVITVAKWSSLTLSGSDSQSMMKVGVMEVVDLGTSWSESEYFQKKQAKHHFYGVILASENIGKAPSFIQASKFNLSFTSKDGTKFIPEDTVQWMKEYKGYSNCIACKTNPWEKAVEGVLLDTPMNLEGGKLEYESNHGEIISFDL